MAVDEEKYPIETDGGHNDPWITYSYPVLVNQMLKQTEGTNLDNDTICYATSSSKRNLSAMCGITHLVFGFNDDTQEEDITCSILKNKKSKYPKAGIVMYRRNSFVSTTIPIFGNVTTGWHARDYKPVPIVNRDNSYGVLGNSTKDENDVSFIAGFDWYRVYGKIMIILMSYDSANGYFAMSGTSFPPSITTVNYDTYKSTYENNQDYVAVGAYLEVWGGAHNTKLSAAPWCGYKSPDYIIGELDPYPEGNTMPTATHRTYDITDLEKPALVFDSGYSSQTTAIRESMNAGFSTFPLVDPLFVSWSCRFFNGSIPYATLGYRLTVADIRGGEKAFTIEEGTAVNTTGTHNDRSNCFYTKVNVDELISAAACYGIIITTNDDRPNNTQTSTRASLLSYGQDHNGKIFVPIPDSNGCYSGEYMGLYDFIQNGEGKSPFYPKTDKDLDEIKNNRNYSYNNAKGGGGEGSEDTDIDETELNDVKLNTIGVFNRCYAVSLNDMKDLADYIYNADDSITKAVIEALKFMGDKPSDALISLVQTPFNIADFVGGGSLSYIKLGRQTTTVQGLILPTSMTSIFDFGTLSIPYPHISDENVYGKCFLDYEPYTNVSLYVPFVGIIELSAKEVIGKNLNVRLVIDWQSNTTCAVVFIGGVMATYRMGIINTSIEMTASDRAINISQIASGILNIAHSTFGAMGGAKQMAGSAIMAVASGGATGGSGIGSGGNKIIDNAFNAAHGALQVYDGIAQPTIYKEIGTPTSACGQFLPPFPYVMLSTVESAPNDYYGQTVGYACNMAGELHEFAGFTVCAGFKSQIARTMGENQLINNALATGVII